MNGFYSYGVSPYQLKAFKGFLVPGFPQYVARTARQLVFILPPAIFFWQLAGWAKAKEEYYHRKVYLLSDENTGGH
ncbi:hypothetical protein HDV04_001393 [Boothiomyces sp. JEL0838]|nr:hypothetical protein HDV04_001393 [Boothiomyces sp. JEL0838]